MFFFLSAKFLYLQEYSGSFSTTSREDEIVEIVIAISLSYLPCNIFANPDLEELHRIVSKISIDFIEV